MTAPDRLGLLDSRAAARYECDARASTCTSHARACDGTIAHYRWWHSVACTECARRESCMLACHMETCEGNSRQWSLSAQSAPTCVREGTRAPGRDGGEHACRRRRSDAGTRTRAAWPVAERHRGAVSGMADNRKKARAKENRNMRTQPSRFCHAFGPSTHATGRARCAPGVRDRCRLR